MIYLFPGDIVWRKAHYQFNAIAFFCNKLAPRFTKCKVIKKITNNTYLLQSLDNNKSGTYHVQDIIKVEK